MANKKLPYIIVAVAASVISVIGAVTTTVTSVVDNEYKENLELAQQFADEKLFEKSVYYYDLVISNKDTKEFRVEELNAIKSGMEMGEFDDDDYQQYLSSFMSEYYDDKTAYEMSLKYYFEIQEYDTCISIINNAVKYGVSSSEINAIDKQIERKYKLVKTNYSNVTPFRNYMAAIALDEQYGVVQDTGSTIINYGYDNVSPYFYASENEDETRIYAFVKDNNLNYLVNMNFVRQAYFPEEVEQSTGVGDELLSCKVGEKYVYYNIDGTKAFGNYDYASKFVTNIAAVKVNDQWALIDTKGNKISQETFDDVKLNGFDECVKNKTVFAMKNGSYVYTAYTYQDGKLVDTGKEFEDVDLPPSSGEYIAFASNDRWGFMDSKLNVVIEPTYKNAHSFSNGYAGVQTDQGWNFINVKNETIIDLDDEFEDTKYFSVFDNNDGSKSGYCYVKLNGAWQLLSLYKCK